VYKVKICCIVPQPYNVFHSFSTNQRVCLVFFINHCVFMTMSNMRKLKNVTVRMPEQACFSQYNFILLNITSHSSIQVSWISAEENMYKCVMYHGQSHDRRTTIILMIVVHLVCTTVVCMIVSPYVQYLLKLRVVVNQ
jgi:hypothetical protein